MYQPILKVYLSLLATLIHGRLGMPTSILLVLLSNVKLREEEHHLLTFTYFHAHVFK